MCIGLVETWFHAMRAHRMGDKERALKYVRKATAGFVGEELSDFETPFTRY